LAHRADALNRTVVTSRPRSGTGRIPLWPVLIGLALIEWAWLYWFLNATLPNSPEIGGKKIQRSSLLWQALPGVVPGFPPGRAILYLAAGELRHVENLPQRVPIVLAAGLIVASAVSLGQLILRGLRLHAALTFWERVPLSFGLGSVGLGITTLLLGRIGCLSPWPIRIGLGILAATQLAFVVFERSRRHSEIADFALDLAPGRKPMSRSAVASWFGFLLIVGPFLILMALAAMLPSYDYDAIEYHLQGPKEYYLAGRITFLEHNVYTSMPFDVEMLHLLGMVVVRDWWWGALVGQLVVACFAPATAAMIWLVARRWASARAAWCAAVVYLTTPWIYRMGAIPYVEGPLCFFHAALVWAALRAWAAEQSLRARLWGVIGLLAGGGMACKYPALVSAVAPFGLVALLASLRERSWRIPVAFGLGVAVAIGPWLVKNAIDTGNPVYPLAYRVFGGRYWDEAREEKWHAAHGPRPISGTAFVDNVIDVAGRSDWQSPLYAALAPLALARPGSRRLAQALWGYLIYLFLTWWLLTHRLDRFWLPLEPVAAILAGLGADWVRSRAWTALLASIMAVAIATNFIYITTNLAGSNEWTSDLLDLRIRVPKSLNPSLARLEAELPRGAKVLLVGQAAVFHFRRPFVYNTVFNREIIESLARDRSADQVQRDLSAMGIDYVYVDWGEIARFRSPGNYGFSAFVIPEVFNRLVDAGVLDAPSKMGFEQELYRVRRGSKPKKS
jgi:Dolichyl-phosphate-mannose-protein mannosyltransferase